MCATRALTMSSSPKNSRMPDTCKPWPDCWFSRRWIYFCPATPACICIGVWHCRCNANTPTDAVTIPTFTSQPSTRNWHNWARGGRSAPCGTMNHARRPAAAAVFASAHRRAVPVDHKPCCERRWTGQDKAGLSSDGAIGRLTRDLAKSAPRSGEGALIPYHFGQMLLWDANLCAISDHDIMQSASRFLSAAYNCTQSVFDNESSWFCLLCETYIVG